MGISLNGGTPKSPILTGFSIINHPFWDTTILRNPHMDVVFRLQADVCFSFSTFALALIDASFVKMNNLEMLGPKDFPPNSGDEKKPCPFLDLWDER